MQPVMDGSSRSRRLSAVEAGAFDWLASRLQARPFRREEAAEFHRVQSPGLLFHGSLWSWASLAGVQQKVQVDRRKRFRPSSLVIGSTGFQRARAASFIQIREPRLQRSRTSDLPAVAAQLPWGGARLASERPPVGPPVLLRPAVQTPEWPESGLRGTTVGRLSV